DEFRTEPNVRVQGHGLTGATTVLLDQQRRTSRREEREMRMHSITDVQVGVAVERDRFDVLGRVDDLPSRPNRPTLEIPVAVRRRSFGVRTMTDASVEDTTAARRGKSLSQRVEHADALRDEPE